MVSKLQEIHKNHRPSTIIRIHARNAVDNDIDPDQSACMPTDQVLHCVLSQQPVSKCTLQYRPRYKLRWQPDRR